MTLHHRQFRGSLQKIELRAGLFRRGGSGVNGRMLTLKMVGLVLLSGACAAQSPPPAQSAGKAPTAAEEALVPSVAGAIAAMPYNIPRAPGPGLRVAVDAAMAAVARCKQAGVDVSVVIADSIGETIVELAGDGAGTRGALVTRTKVATVIRYGMSSTEAKDRASRDPALAAEIAADPNIGAARRGGFPIFKDGKIYGVVGVSGALSGRGDINDVCAKVAVDMLEAALETPASQS